MAVAGSGLALVGCVGGCFGGVGTRLHGERPQSAWIIQAAPIDTVDGIAAYIRVHVRVASGEQDRITCGPAARGGIVFAHPEMCQLRVRVIQSAGEAERLGSWAAVLGD